MVASSRAEDLPAAIAAPHVARLHATNRDRAAVFYVDGHVRAYQGGRRVAKTHIARLRFPAPATVETWVSDAAGDPVLVVMAPPARPWPWGFAGFFPASAGPSATTGGSWSGSTAVAGHQSSSSTWMLKALTC